jgi:hypothetical protein
VRALILCEFSGAVRDAFMLRGHFARSVDLLPGEGLFPEAHYQGDVRHCETVVGDFASFDILIAHPPCTYLCSSGLHWNARIAGRAEKTAEALEFVAWLWSLPIARKCIENPQGCINTRLPYMPRPQFVQPYDFGHDASKKTGLWLAGLKPLQSTRRVDGRRVEWPPGSGRFVERWANQTDSGQNALGPSADRWKKRSITYQGIADAMADQWVY